MIGRSSGARGLIGRSSGSRILRRTAIGLGVGGLGLGGLGLYGSYKRGGSYSSSNNSFYPEGTKGRAYWDNWGKNGGAATGPTPPPYGTPGSRAWM